jgi:hypothetical protein
MGVDVERVDIQRVPIRPDAHRSAITVQQGIELRRARPRSPGVGVAPESLGNLRSTCRPTGVEDEERQQRALVPVGDVDVSSRPDDLDRPEDPKLHRLTSPSRRPGPSPRAA